MTTETSGQGTILWSNKKTTTYTYTNVTASLTCPTFLGVASSGSEIVTTTPTGGNAKITAVGTEDVCIWLGSDDTIYEQGLGSGTI